MEAEEKSQPEEATEADEPEQDAGEPLDLLEHDQPEEAEIADHDKPPAGEPPHSPTPAVEHAEQLAEEPAAASGYDEESLKKWFIIHTYSGFENKVAESLKTRAEAFGFADKIGQILIPTEEVVELRNGKKVTSKRLVYPGYVLVEMEMNDQLWHEVKNTPRVTGFVGGGNAPVPLSADEVNQILYRQQSSAERPRPKMTFEKNDSVRIVDGPFANFSGKVDEVNPERGTLRVMVTIFGRATPVELEFLQVEKA
jgi:transcriptional antiterminator NusG